MKNIAVILSTSERQEELRRFDAAATRVKERVRGNKEAATQFLREVGYYKLMQDEVEEQNAANHPTP